MDNFIDKFGVRVSPNTINFSDCELDGIYVRMVQVQNISSKSLTVRFYPPQAKEFSMMCQNHEKTISPGLNHVCSLKYKMIVEEKSVDRLIVTVDGQVIEIPIHIYPSAPKLEITELVDFGTVVMANKVVTTKTELVNEGSKTGNFRFVYSGNKPLNINPNEGYVHARSSIPIQIEYVTREMQELDEICQCLFEGSDSFEMRVIGRVVPRSLELLDINTRSRKSVGNLKLECIKFPHTYYGSDRSEVALLFNNSPEKINFVAILEEDTVGQETGSHLASGGGGIDPSECTNPLTSLITMYPNQGILEPYQKVEVMFRFSPRWQRPKCAFEASLEPAIEQTFAVFVKIQIVGANSSGGEGDGNEKEDALLKCQQLELGITGTAVPVLVEFEPGFLQFDPCSLSIPHKESNDQHQTLSALLRNKSGKLPARIEFSREAHFTVQPRCLTVPPAETAQIQVTFDPKQFGDFQTKQRYCVFSLVKDPYNQFLETEQIIFEHFFTLTGSCFSSTQTKDPIFNGGIEPSITNKVGLNTDDFKFCDLGNVPSHKTRAALVTPAAGASGQVNGSKLFRCDESYKHPYNSRMSRIAWPNDRAESIKPSERNKDYRTIMKRTKRHNYVDPDYAYTIEETHDILHHKDRYRTLIRKRNMLRRIGKLNAKFASFENELDLGIIPGNNLISPRLNKDEIEIFKTNAKITKDKFQLLSSKELKQTENVIDISKMDTFHAIPTTDQEKSECSWRLSPQQLHQIVIGPSTVNFGDVAIRSSSTQNLSVVNNLDSFIHVTVTIDCKELRQSGPLSQVVPAKTKTVFPLVFDSGKKGKFQRNLNYSINGYYNNHVIVLATVVLNQLDLSTDCLLLKSLPILPPDTSIRGCITLKNPLNSPTEFLWEPIFHNSGGISFSIRPKEGTVEANSQLDCEVMFHPGFTAPSEGDFVLKLPGNSSNEENSSSTMVTVTGDDSEELTNSQNSETTNSDNNKYKGHLLHCVAVLGTPHVVFQSRRVMFGNIPINLMSSRTAVLVNTGSTHAFFRVVPDTMYQELSGMSISPLKGSIPIGGQAELTIKYLPEATLKFDSSIPIVIRGWKEIELKVSGTVIIPDINVNVNRFDFGGVAVGSEKKLAFNLINNSNCRAEVEFEFTKQPDFQIEHQAAPSIPSTDGNSDRLSSSSNLKEKSTSTLVLTNDLTKKYRVDLRPLENSKCFLQFTPTEVASYEFPWIVKVNHVKLTNQSATSIPIGQNIKSRSNTQNSDALVNGNSRSQSKHNYDLICRIITATGTRRPIEFSNTTLEFEGSNNGCKKLAVINTMERPMNVCFKFSSAVWKHGSERSNMKSSKKTKPFSVTIGDDVIPVTEDLQFSLADLGEVMEIKFNFNPGKSGYYNAQVPVFINEDWQHPFNTIDLWGFMSECQLLCEPDYLYFTPVPLGTEICVDFLITAVNFTEDTELDVMLPIVERPKCLPVIHNQQQDQINKPRKDQPKEEIVPFKLAFATPRDIIAGKPSEIWVRLIFYSEEVLSVRSFLQLTTKNNSFSQRLGVSALADNCVLSWLSFFNRHQLNYHIVCEEGKRLEGTEVAVSSGSMEFGEAQLRQISSKDNNNYPSSNNFLERNSSSRNSTTVTSSNFEESSGISFEDSVTENESVYLGTPVAPRDGALNKLVESHNYTPNQKALLRAVTGDSEGSIITSSGDELDINNLDILLQDGSGTTLTLDDIRSGLLSNEDEALLLVEYLKQKKQKENIPNENDLVLDQEEESEISNDYDSPYMYESDLLSIIQRWFAMHGWPGNINSFTLPNSLRSSLQRRFCQNQSGQNGPANKKSKKDRDKSGKSVEENVQEAGMDNTSGVKLDSRDVYDMILHLSGKQVIGINTTVSLPTHPTERACHVYVQNATLIAYIENQAGFIPGVLPEFLMELSEYELWHQQNCPGISKLQSKPYKYSNLVFEKISKKAWYTVLLQVIKAFILSRVTIKHYRQALQVAHSFSKSEIKSHKTIPEVQTNPIASNCYSLNERILLAWLNHLYETNRNNVWLSLPEGSRPPARWIINFDNDFMDSLILATAIAAYIPCLIESHFKFMFPNPQNPEQFLHNSLKIVSALKEIGMEFDIQAIDIVDPNPIMMLLLTIHLFHCLPLYVPKSPDIIFTGALHEPLTKHIQVSNPSSKPLNYDCIILGPDSCDFSCPKGTSFTLPPKGSLKWPVVFKARFTRPAEGLVMLVGRKSGALYPTNLVFRTKSKMNAVTNELVGTNNALGPAIKTEKITGRCYEMKRIDLKLASPYKESGEFTVELVESLEQKSGASNKEDAGNKLVKVKKPPLTLESIKPQNKLRAFFCHTNSLYVNCGSSHDTLPIFYLPFHLGTKSCFIVFSNPAIGEFIQAIEATATLPNPVSLLTDKTRSQGNDASLETSVRVSTAEAASKGMDGDPTTMYWKCEVGRFVKESIRVPVRNHQKERALLEAAQHHLSQEEVSRRQITGTLDSSNLLMTAVQNLSLTTGPSNIDASVNKKITDTKYNSKGNLLNFEVQYESQYFKGPAKIQLPDPLQSLANQKKSSNLPEEYIELPVEFHASSAGTYPVNLILQGPDDVRVHRIECCVTPEGLNARLNFSAPVNDVILQQLPIVNKTRQDWPLKAVFKTGEGYIVGIGGGSSTVCAFSGPDSLVAKALTVSQYPLQFKPVKEGKMNAQLSLINEADGTEHIYELFGEGESPLAIETLYFDCQVGEQITQTLQVPNNTRRKQLFQVESDLDWMIIGQPELTVLPSRNSVYELTIESGRHGYYKGILAFVAGKKQIKEYDSDGEEMPDVFTETGHENNSSDDGLYRIWYSLVVNVNAGAPKDTFTIECPCLQTKVLEIPLHNPTEEKILEFQVVIEGKNLFGDDTIKLQPNENKVYCLEYTPSRKGEFEGKIVFYEETLGEFWYKIQLKATETLEIQVQPSSCELGKCTNIDIRIDNLDDEEDLIIQTEIDNISFSINLAEIGWMDLESDNLLRIKPSSHEILSIKFTPSGIGEDLHYCLLILKTELMGDIKYRLTGTGLPPTPTDVVGINAEAGSNRTVLLPFKNPCLESVLIDISVSEEHEAALDQYKAAEGLELTNEMRDMKGKETEGGIFQLLLKNNKKLKLKAKQSIEIPISFAPKEMRKYKAICSIVLRRKDGEPLLTEQEFQQLVVEKREVPSAYDRYTLRWLYPIQGTPESQLTNQLSSNIPVVHGPIRSTTSQTLAFNLWGLPPPACPLDQTTINQSKAESIENEISEEVQEFSLELSKPRNFAMNSTMISRKSDMSRREDTNVTIDYKTQSLNMDILEESTEIKLEKIEKRSDQGLNIVHCTFNFRPMKKFRTIADIIITSVSGGVWKFPVKFIGTECEPDDEILLEGVGLNKSVSVRFYLNSQSFEPTPFNAYFLKGADPDFSFSPSVGILPAVSTKLETDDLSKKGVAFVVTWTPKSYSRCKGAILIIETDSMEWIYRFNGVPPRFIVPQPNPKVQTTWDPYKLQTMNSTINNPTRNRNFLQQNIDILSTAVSSPIKGAPLFPKIL